jgi:hypothetical protein
MSSFQRTYCAYPQLRHKYVEAMRLEFIVHYVIPYKINPNKNVKVPRSEPEGSEGVEV